LTAVILVGKNYSAVVFCLEIVIQRDGLGSPAIPKLLDELVSLFVGIQMQKPTTFFWSDDLDGILSKPGAGVCREPTDRVATVTRFFKTTMVLRPSSRTYLDRVQSLVVRGRCTRREQLLAVQGKKQ
jgi:hypothetical protein